VDHGSTVKLTNGRYRKLVLPIGKHVISHDRVFGLGQDPQEVNVEAGKTIYLQYVMSWALIFEVADDQ
jgi:hypothetical protein